jgi:hypothetical protein
MQATIRAGQDGVPLDTFSDADMKLLAGVHARGKIRLISGPDNEPHVMLTNLDSLSCIHERF